MFGTAGQGESNEHLGVSSILLRNKYIAPSTKIGERVPIPLPVFAGETKRLIGSPSRRTEDSNPKGEQSLSLFAAEVSDRRRTGDLQPIVGS